MTHTPDQILLQKEGSTGAVPIEAVSTSDLEKRLSFLPQVGRRWVEAQKFLAKEGEICLVPDRDGSVSLVFYGLGKATAEFDPFKMGAIANLLPPGDYSVGDTCPLPELTALAWLMAAYRFDLYTEKKPCEARLICPADVDGGRLLSAARAVWHTRELVDTPANQMGPSQLEDELRRLAEAHSAKLTVIMGDELKKAFPLIHAVGRAAADEPRLLDLVWGDPNAPKVTLVGKGVCFDTGGLDLKPSSAMLLMKKDMGGAANVIGLARMIMDARLKLRLRVLVPAVENSVAGNAFRPGDVLNSRKGITVEIGNTDAEGRLVLADALALADDEEPDLLIDMATLTGAARVALGPDLPPYYTDDDELAAELAAASNKTHDPVWRMPLWAPYREMISSQIADINNAGKGGFAGSLTAALFLKSFVEKAKSYIHFDIYAWTPSAKPGRPVGGEAQAIRALFSLISDRYEK